MARLDSNGKIIMWNGRPWDGKNPPYVETPSGEPCWGEGMVVLVSGPPVVTPEMAKELNRLTPEKLEQVRKFEESINEDV